MEQIELRAHDYAKKHCLLVLKERNLKEMLIGYYIIAYQQAYQLLQEDSCFEELFFPCKNLVLLDGSYESTIGDMNLQVAANNIATIMMEICRLHSSCDFDSSFFLNFTLAELERLKKEEQEEKTDSKCYPSPRLFHNIRR